MLLNKMIQKIDLSVGPIAYYQEIKNPELPTLVFLHDSLGCITLWRDFPSLLATRTQCNILVYDRQGYGQSCDFSYSKREKDYLELEADLLQDLLEKLNIKHPILFGHSDGGSIALLVAAKYPTIIKAIITEGAHLFVEEITIRGIQDALQACQNTDLKRKLEKYHGAKTESMFKAWTETWLDASFRDWNIEEFIPKIQCPILVIQGKNDEFGTEEQIKSILKNPLAKAFIVPNAKHTPHKEQPDFILEQTVQFIEQLHKH